MIEPLLSDDAFLADVESFAGTSDFHAWWLGQSGFLVTHENVRVLFDPYLSESLTAKYAGGDKPHVRMTRRVVDPAKLRGIWAVTSTHSHTDHLDAETLRPIRLANPTFEMIAPVAIEAIVSERLGARPSILMDAGEAADFGPFRITAVPAAHDTLDRDSGGRHRYLGYVLQLGGWTVYHSGDTVLYDGMVEILRPFAIDLAFLPINGKVGNMNGADAARLAHAIGAKLVVPCHYEMFEFNTASPYELFVPECERLGQPYKLLRAGERLTLSK